MQDIPLKNLVSGKSGKVSPDYVSCGDMEGTLPVFMLQWTGQMPPKEDPDVRIRRIIDEAWMENLLEQDAKERANANR
jgi:hypothetical protein